MAGRYVFTIRNGSPYYILRRPEELFGMQDESFYASDPVNSATGNLVDTALDLPAAGGVPGMDLERTYNSRDTTAGDFGRGWSTVTGMRLHSGADGAMTLVLADGRQVPFAAADGGGWRPPLQYDGRLSAAGAGYAVSFPDGTRWRFDADGALLSTSDWRGTTTTVERDAAGAVTRLSSSTGTSVELAREGGHVVAARASDGREVRYRYQGENRWPRPTRPVRPRRTPTTAAA